MPDRIRACSSCHARIFWAVTIGGKSMPMDAKPDPAALWVVDGETELGAPRVRMVEPLLDGDAKRYRPHWATCPHADKHRKRTKQ